MHNTIVIDCSQIPIEKTGVGVYAENMLISLFKIDHHNQYILIVQNDDREFDRFKSDRVKIHYISSKYRNFIYRAYFEQVKLPLLCKKYSASILHSLHYSFPIFINKKVKRVVTFHDMTFFVYPRMHTFLKRHYFKFFIRIGVQMADKIITVSKSTAIDLQKYCKDTDSTKITPIPLASKSIDQVDIHSVDYPYIAFIGTLEPRKNIPILIEAFGRAIKIHKELSLYKLYIVGKKGWYYESIFKKVEELDLSGNIIFTGFVSDKSKFSILKGADLFIYPSFYEGFGLPILEAMTLGVPTITSNISSLPEVAGDAAILVDPYNISDVAEAIASTLLDVKMRTSMSQQGLKQAKKFSWNLCAQQTMKLYEELN